VVETIESRAVWILLRLMIQYSTIYIVLLLLLASWLHIYIVLLLLLASWLYILLF